ncbi:MAG: hypothetical protein V4542_10645 [Pseudomonadota bacterium]
MNKSFTSLLSGTAIALASVCTFSAFAQTPPPPAPAPQRGEGLGKPARPNLKALDVNKDKMLSREEIKGRPMMEKNFDAIDSNKDGQLTRAEMKTYREAHKGERKK